MSAWKRSGPWWGIRDLYNRRWRRRWNAVSTGGGAAAAGYRQAAMVVAADDLATRLAAAVSTGVVAMLPPAVAASVRGLAASLVGQPTAWRLALLAQRKALVGALPPLDDPRREAYRRQMAQAVVRLCHLACRQMAATEGEACDALVVVNLAVDGALAA